MSLSAKWDFFFFLIVIPLTPAKAQGLLQNRRRRDCKSYGMGKSAVECCLLDIPRSLHLGTHSICGCLHKTKLLTSLAWMDGQVKFIKSRS